MHIERGKGGWEVMVHVSQRKKKPFHNSRVLKKEFHIFLISHFH